MLTPPDGKILVAVSGGSDSLALLDLLATEIESKRLCAATVDHGLRPESAQEAQFTANLCKARSIPHVTLKWHDGEAKQEAARSARYDLLARQARETGANTIALAHTQNDQAETIVMRALRAKPDSRTRGLAGIPEYARYDGITLWRPLLKHTRQELREHLSTKRLTWVEDPSNEDTKFERIRVRRALETGLGFPSSQQIARLASLSARTQSWLGRHSAQLISERLTNEEDSLIFSPEHESNRLLVEDVLGTLILAKGGLTYRTKIAKYRSVVDAWMLSESAQINAGRCLISTNGNTFRIRREKRGMPKVRKDTQAGQIFDNRYRYEQRGEKLIKRPNIKALEEFRPSWDDAVHAALMFVLNDDRST